MSAKRLEPRAWLVDKPAGPTSHDIVHGIRRRLPRGTKVGHAGTLDPFATGLLVILVGRATRLADRISAHSKSYRATIRLGARSVTGDPEGPITPGGPVPEPAVVAAALGELAGRTSQRVPLYSAVHVDGQRLYEHARRGDTVERPERQMQILGLDLVEYRPEAGRSPSTSRSARAPTSARSRSTSARHSAAVHTAWHCVAPRSAGSGSPMRSRRTRSLTSRRCR